MKLPNKTTVIFNLFSQGDDDPDLLGAHPISNGTLWGCAE